ncbi:hypothetical protein [Enhygromyxa salina]|nr:hypothetical protein [Enhygromyxa salina]
MTDPSKRPTYVGVFLLALATLVVEILLTRISSVIGLYHLAFFVISLTMLGMTAGAVAVFLLPSAFEQAKVPDRMAQAALGFALSTPIAVGVAMSMPLVRVDSLMGFLALSLYAGALAIPNVFAGVALTLALTRAQLLTSIAYGVDLLGAAAGCGLVIVLLDLVDAPSAVLVAAGLAGLGAASFAVGAANRGLAVGAGVCAVCLFGLGYANASAEQPALRPAWVKGAPEDLAQYDFVGWNTYSRITVNQRVHERPHLWAGSRLLPPALADPVDQRSIKVDGAAATRMFAHANDLDAHAYLDWDITSFVHQLRPSGPAAIIGVGGGRDVIVAARHGHAPIVGIELNDLIVHLHTHGMAAYSGLIEIPGVELHAAEARSFLQTETRRFSVITMSLIDTWAATGAGSYSLSENGLYTVEAWDLFLNRLDDHGVFTVSRWYNPKSPGETARMLALAMDVLWRRGVEDPRAHLIVLQNLHVATLLVSPAPFSTADIDTMQQAAVRMGFTMLATPRRGPLHEGTLAQLWAVPDHASLGTWADKQALDLSPPTDDRPFFFNMLTPQRWLQSPGSAAELDVAFLGNLEATQTLVYATLVSLLLALTTIVAPLLVRWRALAGVPRLELAASTAYFTLIGLGFMFVEIGLLSRLNVFLGHPTLALAVLLGAIISFTGLGSLASAKLPIESSARLARVYPLIPFALVLVALVSTGPLTHAFVGGSLAVRILVGVGIVAVPALGMGLGFPLGLRLVQRRRTLEGGPELGPWLWGMNGAAGVCASGLALIASMAWGVPVTLGVGAACYLVLLPCTWVLSR